MRGKKVYGESKIYICPFCDKKALTENKQGVPVCLKHKGRVLSDLKCVCGNWLDVMKGKWGAFFNCINCGNINLGKGLEINPSIKSGVSKEANKERPKRSYNAIKETKNEVVLTSREADFYC